MIGCGCQTQNASAEPGTTTSRMDQEQQRYEYLDNVSPGGDVMYIHHGYNGFQENRPR